MIDIQIIWQFFESSKYIWLFLLMIIDGPITTAAAAFASTLGTFNLWIVFIMSFFGNTIPDIFCYGIGRFSRGGRIERFVGWLGIKKGHIRGLERGLKNHGGKTLILSKLTPLLPVPALLLAGFGKFPAKKFFTISIIFNMISAVIFIAIGYYFGIALGNLLKYLKFGEYIILFLVIFVITVYFVYKGVSKYFERELEEGLK